MEIAGRHQLDYEGFDYLAPLLCTQGQRTGQHPDGYHQERLAILAQRYVPGGQSFARTMPNCVAFGLFFPG